MALLAAPAVSWAGSETAKLVPSDGLADDYCGYSVGLSGNLALVGAPHHSEQGGWSGAAYVYDALTGLERWKLVPADGAITDQFGFSVAISGTLGIVGAPGDNDNGSWSGSAYLFDLATGTELTKLLASDGAANSYFGTSVALSGTTALVGAYGGSASLGAVYVFDTTTGLEVRKLQASDAAIDELFGYSVALSGGIAIVGAPLDTHVASEAGSAYLFELSTGQELAKLVAPDAADLDNFGWSVGLSGTTAIIGAWGDDDNGADSGSAYLFNTTTGAQVAKLLPADGAAADEFGYTVAIQGSTAIVGAHGRDDNGSESGAAYLFDPSDGAPVAKLMPTDAGAGAEFGWSVALDGLRTLIGAYRDTPGAILHTGSAYVFGPTIVTSYCTAGTSSSGCQVTLSATGSSSASAASGFVLLAERVEGLKDGMFFFGTQGRQATTWGNGSSLQCIVPPVVRTDLVPGGGTFGACDASFAQDLNARWAAQPMQNPGAGAIVQVQLWYRDPLNTSNQTTSLSDALEFCVAP